MAMAMMRKAATAAALAAAHAGSSSTLFARTGRFTASSSSFGRALALAAERHYTSAARRRMQENMRPQREFNVREEKLGIKIERNVIAERLAEYSASSWMTRWKCKASKFPWTYDTNEIFYLLKGKVNIYPDGQDDYVQIEAGDICIMPKGMSCTWDVLDDLEKTYKLYL